MTEHSPCRHEAGFYDSDEGFRGLIVPWIEEGVAAGEPVVIAYDDRRTALLRAWLPDSSGVTLVGDQDAYVSPARTIASFRRMFEDLVAGGAARIRAAGVVPHPGTGRRFEGWDRYEIALNTVWDDLPVWARCLYDGSTTPADVRDVVQRSHPYLVGASGAALVNERYEGIAAFRGLQAAKDPITNSTAPTIELHDPTPGEARRAVVQAGRWLVDDGVLDHLALGVSEAVINAHQHGRPPASLRLWSVPGSVVAHVHDQGGGTSDPLAGLVRGLASGTDARLGLWIMHQLDLTVDLVRAPDGFTVQLRAGDRPTTSWDRSGVPG